METEMATTDSAMIAIWTYRAGIEDPGNITGYAIQAIDGDIGKVDKHDGEAGRSHLLVATGPWILGKTVMLPAGVIDRINHEEATVHVSCTKDQIKGAPEYQPDRYDDQDYRREVGGYYGSYSAQGTRVP
jgi:hypothetical protein